MNSTQYHSPNEHHKMNIIKTTFLYEQHQHHNAHNNEQHQHNKSWNHPHHKFRMWIVPTTQNKNTINTKNTKHHQHHKLRIWIPSTPQTMNTPNNTNSNSEKYKHHEYHNK